MEQAIQTLQEAHARSAALARGLREEARASADQGAFKVGNQMEDAAKVCDEKCAQIEAALAALGSSVS